MSNILVNTAYFPPVQYFTKIKECTEIWIEQYESYGKQSYRNRCDIMTANGIMTLSSTRCESFIRENLNQRRASRLFH